MGSNKEYVEPCINVIIESKAPVASNEEFTKVSQAFKRQSDEGSRGCYDQCKLGQPCKGGQSYEKFYLFCVILLLISYFALKIIVAVYSSLIESPYLVVIYDDYQFPMVTKEYGIEFYVKSSYKFDQKYPVGTQSRADIEDRIIKDYFEFASSCCDYEQEWHRQCPDIPTPVCDKLQQLRKHQT
ncbi:hypothetical protein Tco_1340141 [Tanacetum coccineum]